MNSKRRWLTPPAMLAAGLVILIAGCSGETPTAPSSTGGGSGKGGGACDVAITMTAVSVIPLAGTADPVRATVTRTGVPVPDGTSVAFTTDFGFFNENGLPTVSKVTVGGAADVTLGAFTAGTAHVKAVLECAIGQIDIQYQPIPADGPFISSIVPDQGSCAGADTVIINGGRFGTDVSTIRVTFGGASATVTSVTGGSQITVKTPARTLANAQVPETVDVVVLVGVGTAGATSAKKTNGFTYRCIDPNQKIFISSVNPAVGLPAGGEAVTIAGGHFGTNVATTRVTFCGATLKGASAQIVSQSDSAIVVTTPRHTLDNAAVPETCDVGVEIDLGLVSKQAAVLPAAFTYRDVTGQPFISSIVPNSGSPNGAETVVINGGNFGTVQASTRVSFCGANAQIVSQSASTLTVTTPAHALANPSIPEVCDVTVKVNASLANEQSVTASKAFTYRDSTGRVFISSVQPTFGTPAGGDTVLVSGGNFGTNASTTRVTLCGDNAQVTNLSDIAATITTPRHTLANANVPETCDVTLTRDFGLATQQSGTLAQAFSYRNAAGQLFVSTVVPNTGTSRGGDTVVVNGGGFGTTQASTRVNFCGTSAQITGQNDAAITVTTPRHALANPAIPETCDVTVIVSFSLPAQRSVTLAQAFTFRDDGRMFVSSVAPIVGSELGLEAVTIAGGNFGTNAATTRVTFCGTNAQIQSVSDASIAVTTPRHLLANPSVPETCDVAVTRDLGLPSQQNAVLPAAFTYRGSGPGRIFISSVTPNLGSEQGGEAVTIAGGNFGTTISTTRVAFCGTSAQILSVADASIAVTTPRHLLANPAVPETCDVSVTRDLGLPTQQSTVLAGGFSYRGTPGRAFISSVVPNSGAAAGGESVVVNGGGFGTNSPTTKVTFCGASAQITAQAANAITVTTPRHTLANPSVPEVCDVAVTIDSGLPSQQNTSLAQAYTYREVAGKPFISSVLPSSGSQAGGESVIVSGGNFGTVTQTTRVTFCGLNAQIANQSDASITVLTPRHTNANPALPETCDVSVFTNFGLSTQQTGTLPQAFTYRGGAGGGGGICNTDPAFFISSITPNSGPPDGGTAVTIIGGGFGTTAANIRVDFGTTAAQITSVSNNSITVTSPRRVLANPNTPEIVDIIVTDLGSSTGRCARLTSAYSYTVGALDPVIYSISPRTGPNDASTRVTIFGSNFQFPEQVFLTGGGCGAQRVEATVVNPIQLSTIVFATPIASGGNACLANQLVDVQILNPVTGKGFTLPQAFKYYGCPPASAVANPSLGAYNQSTIVTINGQNFEEPVEITYTITAPNTVAGQVLRPQVTSVSSALIVLTMPPLTTILQGVGNPSCTNVTGTITIRYLSLSCSPTTADFAYRVDPPSMTNASPTSLNQDGTPFPGPIGGTAQLITVLGANFTDPMTVTLLKDGVPVSGTAVNNAIVSNPGSLTFYAQAVLNSAMNQDNCLFGGSVIGTKFVPTSFGIRVTNTRTGCFSDLPNILIYNPTDTVCRVPLQVVPVSLPPAVLCVPYIGSVSAIGGTSPYSFSASGLPNGLVMNANGTITGTPVLSGPGTGGPATFIATVTVIDALAKTASQQFTVLLSDPAGPFGISGASSQSVGSGGGPGSTLTANPVPTPAGYTPVSWTIDSINPAPGAGTISRAAPTGQTNNLTVTGTVPAGIYTVVVRATDVSPCGGPPHTATISIQLTKSP